MEADDPLATEAAVEVDAAEVLGPPEAGSNELPSEWRPLRPGANVMIILKILPPKKLDNFDSEYAHLLVPKNDKQCFSIKL
jgi:hypothetical protein